MLTKENQIRIAAVTMAIFFLLAALVLILDRFPELQESRWVLALGIFATITSPIAVYEFLARRSYDPEGSSSKSGQIEIRTGGNLEISGDQQGTVTQNDQRGQTVEGPQTNVGVAQGPVFSGPVTYNASAKPALPMQKPPLVQHFIGRKDELASLIRDIQPGMVVTICGPGGMGKTALAAEAVWRLASGNEPPQLFPDGIIFYSFYHKPQAVLALEHIARSYGEDPRPSSQQAAIRALAGRKALIVLDGAEECDDLSEVLMATASCAVIITTRRSSDAPAEFCNLPPLSIGEAVRLLRAWAGELASDESIAQRICELLGRLPLAIFLVGRYMAHRRQMAREYLAWLEKTPLSALDLGDRQHESIPLLMEHSLSQVSDRARSCMGIAGVLAQKSFGPGTISAALELPLEDANQALGELVDFGLLIRPDARYQITHALAHTYARLKLAPARRILSCLARHYADLATEKAKLGPASYALLDAERDHILAVQSACHKAELWGSVRKIAWAFKGYLDLQGYWAERIALLQAGLNAAHRDGMRQDEGSFLSLLGSTYNVLGDVRKAIEYHKQALAISKEIGFRQGEASELGNLGVDYEHSGDVCRAIECHKRALLINREIGYIEGEGTNLGNLGIAYLDLEEIRKAIECFDQVLIIAREIGDTRKEGLHLNNLGLAYKSLGEIRRAIEYYDQALIIAREIGDKRSEGAILGNLGSACYILSQPRKAIEFFMQQLDIVRNIGDKRGEGNALWNMSLVLDNLGNRAKATECAEAALKIREEIEDPAAEKVKRKLQEWDSSQPV